MSSDTILARSPTGVKVKPKLPDKRKLNQRVKDLFTMREPWFDKWKQIRDYELPFIGEFEDDDDKSKNYTGKICDSTAWESSQIFASGIMSGLTPPSRQWFKLGISNRELQDNTEVAKVLDERQEILTSVLSKSNFYTAVFSVYSELPYGQCPMAIFSNPNTAVQFVPFTIGTYALGCGANGQVNTFVRKFTMTPAQMKDQFGEENLPQNIQRQLANNDKYTKKHKVIWLVEPNENRMPDKKGRKNMPYSSIYWVEDSGDGEFLYVGGFEEWAIPTARYMVTGLEPYAKGAGWFALADAKMLQKLNLDLLTAIELGVKPPMQVSPSLSSDVNLFPGGLTVTDVKDAVKQLFEVNINVQHLDAKILRVEDSIKRAYCADLFLMLDNLGTNTMTAREVLERTQEKLQQLAPMVERLQYEFLNPIIERVYNVLDRAGVFPPIPDEVMMLLSQQEVKIEYISPLAQAQKMNGLTSIEQGIAFVANLMQLYPEVRHKINPIETVNRYFSDLGCPAVMLRSDDEASQLTQQEQQQAQQQAEQAQMMEMAQASAPASQAVKNVAELAQNGNPAMQSWLGMGGLQ
ncbi:MAG: portal protein [Culicoidibacterales bacterium]